MNTRSTRRQMTQDHVKNVPIMEQSSQFLLLPTEMIQCVLIHLSRNELLRMRLVNKQMMEISSSICRSRLVCLNSWQTFEPLGSLNANKDHLPWSACELQLYQSWKSSNVPEFLGLFGAMIKAVTLESRNWQSVLKALQFLPNIQSLDISIDPFHIGIVTKPPYITLKTKLELTKLQKLNVRGMHGNTLDFLMLILRITKLKHIELEYSTLIPTRMKQLASALAKIPSIFLEFLSHHSFDSKGLDIFTSSNLKVTGIQLGRTLSNQRAADYKPLEQFLVSISATLKKIIFYNVATECDEKTSQLQLPTLPALCHMELRRCFRERYHYWTENIQYLFLSPFTSTQLPSLRKVVITDYHPTIPAFSNDIFESVTELDVFRQNEQVNSMAHKWGTIFPNLRKLDDCCVDTWNLIHVLECMKNLEVLSLYIYKASESSPDPPDVNEVLSGVRNPDRVYKKSNIGNRSKNSLLSLTKLRRLTLKFSGYGDCQLRDSGVMLSLVQLHSLHELTLKYSKISNECIQKLKERHYVVHILEYEQPILFEGV